MGIKSKLAVCAATALLTLGLAPTAAQAAAQEDSARPTSSFAPFGVGGCSVSVDNPHLSAGAGGADVKARFKCDTAADPQHYTAQLYLYVCSSSPPSGYSLDYLRAHCTHKASSNYSSFTVQTGRTVTLQAPEPGSALVHGSGYWAGLTEWTTACCGPLTNTSRSNVVKFAA